MLVSAKEMLKKAHAERYAVAHFNINNLEWIKSILTACEEAKAPVIIGVSEGAAKYMCGYQNVYDMVKNVHDRLKITVPVALHLDHGTFEGAKACIEVGFTSVMFDGSHLSFEENYAKSKEIVEYAKSKGVSVEVEVGAIGGEEDGVASGGELACPEEAKKMAALGIDALAAGIGNIHGKYPADWKSLNFEVLQSLQEAAQMPMVLHGGSGIPKEQVLKAISLGISKINVNTELQLVFQDATRKYIEAGKDQTGKGYDPRKLLAPGCEAIVAKCIEMLKDFGSYGKA